jgi:hypothetical protein
MPWPMTHTVTPLPCEILERYTEVNFDANCLMTNSVTKKWIFLPDMPHLTKNIIISLKLVIFKEFKMDLRYSVVPINMHMIEEEWLK